MFVYGNKSRNYGNAAIQAYFSPGHRHNRMQRMTKMIIELSHQTQLYSGYIAVVVTEGRQLWGVHLSTSTTQHWASVGIFSAIL